VASPYSVYARSPRWVQNLMVSVQGFIHNRRRWDLLLGRELLRALLESQWWDEERFREFQNAALRAHLRLAADQVPYYRNLFRSEGIDPADIRTTEDLTRLPLLEKDVVRKQPAAFLRGGRPLPSWNRLFTSGTTGSPLALYSSRESFTRVWSFVFRLRTWAGLSDPVFPRRAQFTGRDIIPPGCTVPDGVYWRRNVPANTLLFSSTHISGATVPHYAWALRTFRPEVVEGYPSAIVAVARLARRLTLELPRPRAIIVSAESLFDEDRREIEAAFGCPVFNQYASSDTAAFISQCEAGSMHINPEFGICEVLNDQGKPANPGEPGEVVATSFCNQEQVFIRYRIKDEVIAGPAEPCRCGRRMPRVTAVTGRIDDTLFVSERGFVGRLDPCFKGVEGIVEAQIVQETLDHITVSLVPNAGYDNRVQAVLVANLRKKLGDAVTISVQRVSHIPRGPNGKFRSVVSRCTREYPVSGRWGA
jgi:phenylacetate-CoA ligase